MPTHSISRISLVLLAFAAYPATQACTVFDDAFVPAPTASTSSGQGGAGVGGANANGGGTSTSTTSSTSSGTGGAPPSASAAYLTETEAARLCSGAVLCPRAAKSAAISTGVPIDAMNFSQCMTWLAGPLPANHPGFQEQQAVLKCAAAANSCAGAIACFPYVPLGVGNADCADGISKCIDAQSAADCQKMVAMNCAADGFAAGSTCAAQNGIAVCASGPCSTPGAAVCMGDTRVECTAAGEVSMSCALSGLACTDNGQNSAACTGGGACSGAGTTQCAGSIARVCTGAAWAEFNCASINADCIVGPDGQARCEIPGSACTPYDAGVNTCAAGKKKITLCVGGSTRTINCPIGSCQTGGAGQSDYCG